jgi:farnesyl diphosphate synthase
MSFSSFVTEHQARIQRVLEQHLPSPTLEPISLHQAMSYSVLNGGKRIRPLLVYAVGKTFNADLEALDAPACAVEMIHCYSLIHDDLPAMDNDDLRRGKPTCHKAFDEATAILAGDALQALAFEVIAHDSRMIKLLTQACGSKGMAGGQAFDIAATGKSLTKGYVENMHAKKTGALIAASVQLAALASACTEPEFTALTQYGAALGLAFQIHDDVLDIETSTEKLGKQQGADQQAGKLTYPQVMGIEASRQRVEELYQVAINSLKTLHKPVALLEDLAGYLVKRES